MMERFLSAPGKLFLSGEYAVLWGGTARIAAVGPRAFAHVRRRDDREVHLVLQGGRLVGHATPAGIRGGQAVPPEFRFAARSLGEAVRAHAAETLGFELALSPSPAAQGGRKLGLGGSARAAVLSAEAARYVLEERFDPLRLAMVAHAAEQGMKGSGGDVAAIFAGGLIRYRRYPVEPIAQASSSGQLAAALSSAPPVDLWRVPAKGVLLSFAFAGESASTPAQISRAEAALQGAARDRFVAESDVLGDALERALVQSDFRELRAAVQELRRLLGKVGPLENEAAKRVLAMAESHGSAGKTSGAGGGDVCVLFSPDEGARSSLAEALSARGFYVRPAELEPGLRGEPGLDPSLRGWL